MAADLTHVPTFRADERAADYVHALCGARPKADLVSDYREDVTCPKCLALLKPASAGPPHFVDTEYCGDTMPIRLSFQIRVF